MRARSAPQWHFVDSLGRYPYDLIDCASFDEAWARFMADYQAVNVTAPFKEQALARVLAEGGSVSEDAAAVGAVNIVVRASGQKGPKMTVPQGNNPGVPSKSAENASRATGFPF